MRDSEGKLYKGLIAFFHRKSSSICEVGERTKKTAASEEVEAACGKERKAYIIAW